MPREHVNPDDVVAPVPLASQKNPGILRIEPMIGRRPILEVFFGNPEDRGIHFHDIDIDLRPVMGKPFRHRSPSLTHNEGPLGVRRQGQCGDKELAVRKVELDRVDQPHHGMKGPVQDQIAKQIIVANANLLVRAVLLVHRLRKDQNGMEGERCAEHNARQHRHRGSDAERNRPPPPQEAQQHLDGPEQPDEREAAHPRQEVKGAAPRSHERSNGGDRNHPARVAPQVSQVRDRKSEEGG